MCGAARSSAGTVSDHTTSRAAPTRAISTATGVPSGDDRCRPTGPPGAIDWGQQYPVTVRNAIAQPTGIVVMSIIVEP